MTSKSKKESIKISYKISPESLLYMLTITFLILILIYFIKPNTVVPTRVKTFYRDYIPKYFSEFVFFFYSILVMHSAFKPIWFIFWPLLFYCIGKKFFKNRRMVKYYVIPIGLLFAYLFYAIPNHSIVPSLFTFKPIEFTIDKEFPALCKEKNVMVFAPPDIYLLDSSRILDWYVNFTVDWSNYIDKPIYYVCVGNGTFVNVSLTEWNPEKKYCPNEIKYTVSSEKYNEILMQPRSLFPMFVFDCDYVVSPYPEWSDRKEWIDIFCFHSGFVSFKCFLHLLNPSTGVFLPPKHLLYE